jgi:hypothetical protein
MRPAISSGMLKCKKFKAGLSAASTNLAVFFEYGLFYFSIVSFAASENRFTVQLVVSPPFTLLLLLVLFPP